MPKNRIKGTVWEHVKEQGEQVEIDGELFETLFAQKAAPKPALSRGASSSSSACVALLDPKRANNISIILSRLKMPFEEMRRAIVEVDMEALPHESVTALLKCAPTAEEVELVGREHACERAHAA